TPRSATTSLHDALPISRDQETGDGARLEGELEAAGERSGRRLRRADVGAHRDVHADEAGRTRQDGADGKAARNEHAEEVGQQPRSEEHTSELQSPDQLV